MTSLTFEDVTLEGVYYDFYEPTGDYFKLGNVVFYVIEDGDGWRSYVSKIVVDNEVDKSKFGDEPVALLKYHELTDYDGNFDGYVFFDEHEREWFRVGTDNSDSYYPWVDVKYSPQEVGTISRSGVSPDTLNPELFI